MTANLTDKAINIHGKKYVLVSDRVLAFNELYENGSITTELISDWNSDLVVVKATVTPDTDKPTRIFTGYSQEIVGSSNINKTSALENAETSAVGRALAMMGIGVIESIASADEMNKAVNRSQAPQAQVPGSLAGMPRKTCDTCKYEFSAKGDWQTTCYDCYKKSK